MNKKSLAWKIVTLILLLGAAIAMTTVYVFKLKPQPIEGNKQVDVILVVRDGDINQRVTYRVNTDAENIGDVIRRLDEDYNLGVETKKDAAGEMLMGLYGVETPDDWSKYFQFFTDFSDIALKDDPWMSSTFYNNETVYPSNYGVFDTGALVSDGCKYIIAYGAMGEFNAEKNENDEPTKYIPYAKTTLETDVWVTDEMKGYVRQLNEANNMLITVCSVVGAAFVVILAMSFIDFAKAKRNKQNNNFDDQVL